MLVIPIASDLYETLKGLAATRRMVFMTGLPGTGKSLLIQQLALIASEAGRQVHLLQYNLAREPFETTVNLAKYPELDGVTDPAIRKAVGLWARQAVQRWHQQNPDPAHLLIGELPLIGNRLIELVEKVDDPAEGLLSSEQAMFVVPVPSWEVREVIEAQRAKTIANPQNEREKLDAPPNVLQALWQELNGLARQIGLTRTNPQTPYNPYIYGGVYQALLQHRHSQLLLIDQVLRPAQSVYELAVVVSRLQADAAEVDQAMREIERRYTPETLTEAIADWHAIITADPSPPDPGPALRLPLPENLTSLARPLPLNEAQRTALRAILALPLEAGPAQVLPVLDQALSTLMEGLDPGQVTAGVAKFDVYDSYFNVSRSADPNGLVFLAGLLQAYRNVLADLQTPPQTLTVIEMPLLRIALETSLSQFDI
jgi:hypothetical protein